MDIDNQSINMVIKASCIHSQFKFHLHFSCGQVSIYQLSKGVFVVQMCFLLSHGVGSLIFPFLRCFWEHGITRWLAFVAADRSRYARYAVACATNAHAVSSHRWPNLPIVICNPPPCAPHHLLRYGEVVCKPCV